MRQGGVSGPDGKRMRFTNTERERVQSLLALVLQIFFFETNALRTDRRNFRYGAVAGGDTDGADTAGGANSRSLLMDLAFEILYLCGINYTRSLCVCSCVPVFLLVIYVYRNKGLSVPSTHTA